MCVTGIETIDMGIFTMPEYAVQRLASLNAECAKSPYSSLPVIMMLDEELERHLIIAALAVQQRNLACTV